MVLVWEEGGLVGAGRGAADVELRRRGIPFGDLRVGGRIRLGLLVRGVCRLREGFALMKAEGRLLTWYGGD